MILHLHFAIYISAVEDESVISDPQPNHYLVNDKLVSRKKFITGPRDSLPVPGQFYV